MLFFDDLLFSPSFTLRSLVERDEIVIKNHPIVRANASAASRVMVPTENWGVPPGWGRRGEDLRRGWGGHERLESAALGYQANAICFAK